MSPPRLLVTGGSGHLGGELVRCASDAGWEVCGTSLRTPGHVHLDVRDAAAVEALVADRAPDCVIHTAYLQDGPDAWATNVEGSANVATAAAGRGARLIHLSTDLVFDGRAGPYAEEDAINPLLDYGRSKAAGERVVAERHPEATIVRTSLIYGGEGLSGHERRILDVVDGRADLAFFTDELRCPVHVSDLARALLALAAIDHAGPLHLAGADGVSRYELACLVAAAHGREFAHLRTTTSAGMRPERPRDCRLDCSRAAALLGGPLLGVRGILGN
ncbi:MAG TPA: SDR family oxidoreductase [Gaiellales bacterium]|nr:SDR family oxidoreductase [Gaiellales bacterium]